MVGWLVWLFPSFIWLVSIFHPHDFYVWWWNSRQRGKKIESNAITGKVSTIRIITFTHIDSDMCIYYFFYRINILPRELSQWAHFLWMGKTICLCTHEEESYIPKIFTRYIYTYIYSIYFVVIVPAFTTYSTKLQRIKIIDKEKYCTFL